MDLSISRRLGKTPLPSPTTWSVSKSNDFWSPWKSGMSCDHICRHYTNMMVNVRRVLTANDPIWSPGLTTWGILTFHAQAKSDGSWPPTEERKDVRSAVYGIVCKCLQNDISWLRVPRYFDCPGYLDYLAVSKTLLSLWYYRRQYGKYEKKMTHDRIPGSPSPRLGCRGWKWRWGWWREIG